MEKQDTITVTHNGNRLVVYKEVADELNLQPNQNVSTDLFWIIIGKNSSLGIEKCQISNN